MYTLVTTYGRAYDPDIGVREFDSSEMLIRSVINENDEVYFVLTNPYILGERLLNPKLVASDIFSKSPTLTVNGWLQSIGDMTLPTTNQTISLDKVRAVSQEAYSGGYNIHPSTGNYGTDTGNVLIEEMDDLRLEKEGVDYNAMTKQVLVSVGGYFHLTDADVNGLYVIDGGVTARKAQTNQVMLTSLHSLGECIQKPLKDCPIAPANEGGFKNGVFINTDVSLTNKTVWLVLGGFILTRPEHFTVLSDKIIYVDYPSLLMERRYMVSKDTVDLSALDALMDTNGRYLKQGGLDEDNVIAAYFGLSQSFILILDNPTVTTNLLRLEDAGLPGKYYCYEHPYSPMVDYDGCVVTTAVTDEHKTWVISTSVDEGMIPNFFSKRDGDRNDIKTDMLVPSRPRLHTGLYRMDITSTVMTLT